MVFLILRAGIGANCSYTWGLPDGVSPWNASVSANLGVACNISKFGQMAGLGIGCSYGTQGWGFGAHSYCEILPAQEKLDRIVRYYSSDLKETFGESGVGNVYAGTRRNMKFAKGKLSVYGDFLIDDEGRIAYGAHMRGKAFDLIEIDGYSCKRFSGNDIYISKARIRQIWRGDAIALETLYHEWQHSCDYYSGCADYYYQYYGQSNEACSNWLEHNAYSLNYSRISDAVFLNRIVYYNNRINEWNRINGY